VHIYYRITERGNDLIGSYSTFCVLSEMFTCANVQDQSTELGNMAWYLSILEDIPLTADEIWDTWEEDPEFAAEMILDLVRDGYLEKVTK